MGVNRIGKKGSNGTRTFEIQRRVVPGGWIYYEPDERAAVYVPNPVEWAKMIIAAVPELQAIVDKKKEG